MGGDDRIGDGKGRRRGIGLSDGSRCGRVRVPKCEGGFGVTYRARCDVGVVALKEMRIEQLRSWKELELFGRAAEALRRLRHPRIPAYIDFFALRDGEPVAPDGPDLPTSLTLVREWVEGTTLAQRVARGAPSTRRSQRVALEPTVRLESQPLRELSESSIARGSAAQVSRDEFRGAREITRSKHRESACASPPAELDGVAAAVRSQIDVSIMRILGESDRDARARTGH